METIGTDINLEVCKAEGYFMLDYDPKEAFRPDKQYRVYAYFPEHLSNLSDGGKPAVDTTVSWNELMESYKADKEGIDKFDDYMPWIMDQQPDIHSVLKAADTIHMYKGLP